MPWTHCEQQISDDASECPSCGISKAAWTIELNATRTFVVAKKGARKKKTSWVEVLVEGGAGAEYELELPDGQVARGSLDDEGRARHEGLYPGECLLDLGALAVEPQGGTTRDEEGLYVCATDAVHRFRAG